MLWVSGSASSTRIMWKWIIPTTSPNCSFNKDNTTPAEAAVCQIPAHVRQKLLLSKWATTKQIQATKQTKPTPSHSHSPPLCTFSIFPKGLVDCQDRKGFQCSLRPSGKWPFFGGWSDPIQSTLTSPNTNTPRKETIITKTPRCHWSPICPVVPTWCHWWCTSLVGRCVVWWRFSCRWLPSLSV